jgi:hypothetical protein
VSDRPLLCFSAQLPCIPIAIVHGLRAGGAIMEPHKPAPRVWSDTPCTVTANPVCVACVCECVCVQVCKQAVRHLQRGATRPPTHNTQHTTRHTHATHTHNSSQHTARLDMSGVSMYGAHGPHVQLDTSANSQSIQDLSNYGLLLFRTHLAHSTRIASNTPFGAR